MGNISGQNCDKQPSDSNKDQSMDDLMPNLSQLFSLLMNDFDINF